MKVVKKREFERIIHRGILPDWQVWRWPAEVVAARAVPAKIRPMKILKRVALPFCVGWRPLPVNYASAKQRRFLRKTLNFPCL
jgi:hypothetical protein